MTPPALMSIFAAAAFALAACDRAPNPAACGSTCAPAADTVVVRPSAEETVVSLKRGQTLVLEFDMNAGTGFDWTLKSTPAAGVLTGGAFADTYPPFGKPGEAGVRRFTFRAAKAGRQDLAFDFSRGEPNPAFDRHAVIRVTVGG